jgi:hypothetical protein
MTLDTFFEKFDLFADAPGAVTRMRELVLELAVRGALSNRHPSDQKDAAWRAFVSTLDERSRDADTDAEPPFEIPTAWRWACLDDLGITRVRNDVEDSTRASFVPMALISSTYGVDAQSEERTWSEIKKGFTHFADGDVVMAKITPCFENGKSAVMRYLVNGRAAVNDPDGFFHIIANDAGYDPLIEHLRSRHLRVHRYPDFASFTSAGKPRPPTLSPPVDSVVTKALEHLRKNKSNQAKTRKGLVSVLQSISGKPITADNVGTTIESLVKAGHLAIDEKDKVAYRL